MRFRRYLGKNYIRKETFIDSTGNETSKAIPIITIYFLGYNLLEYDSPAILVNNQVIDATTKQPINYKNDFVELLTHPSYILQIDRLKPERKTKIEKFLSFFDQSNKTEDDYILEIDDTLVSEFQEIAKYLNLATQDEEIIRQLEYEEEYDLSIENLEDQLEEKEKLLQKERKEKEELLQKERKEKEEKEELLQKERKEKEEKEELLQKERKKTEEKELEIKRLLQEIEKFKTK
jgi:hypothetical protein